MQLDPTTLCWVLGPQGFGLHGLSGCSGSVTTPSVATKFYISKDSKSLLTNKLGKKVYIINTL